jgi:predicted amino acid-binding ACT domain protein
VKGKQAQAAASAARLSPARDIGTLRVEGPNRAGVGHDMTRAIADAGINLRGVSAAVLGNNFIAYFGFDSVADANRAAKVLSKVGQAGGATARRRGRSASKR